MDLVNLYLKTDEDGFCGTNRRPKTHISETRTVQLGGIHGAIALYLSRTLSRRMAAYCFELAWKRDTGDERAGDTGVDVRGILQGDKSNREAGRRLHCALESQVIRLLSQLLREHWKTHHGGLQRGEDGHE